MNRSRLIPTVIFIFSLLALGFLAPSTTVAANMLDNYKKEEQKLLTEQRKLSQQLEQDQSKLDSLLRESKTISLDTQKVRVELDAVQTKLTDQRKQVSSLNLKIKEYRKKNKALASGTKQQRAKYQRELATLQTDYKKLQAKVESLVKERERINQRYTAIKKKLEQNRNAIAKSRNSLTTNKGRVGQIASNLSKLKNQILTEEALIASKLPAGSKPSNSQDTSNAREPELTGDAPVSSGSQVKDNYAIDAATLTEKEKELAKLINDYRISLGLKPLPISKSLTTVARTHVVDSNQYAPEKNVDVRGVKCNLHSWSSNGKWSDVCYTPDHEYAKRMWDKPRELTSYPGNGYEISVYYSAEMSPSVALKAWQGSSGHNNVIIGDGAWSNLSTMGIGIHGNYAHVWFGKESDPAGEIK
ncbi:hypothetical protein NCCP2222_33220 [Sporosarcina sp. NCCP-2222]|uniref:CAP domain-containing protein n=1 Tax=Sporosarcina sp. NCCP-2222 TaxID=2935073 RepID=UPI00207E9DF3|nr:CAP domain-containing protein [Sporosarcina sp. NCCP-2222]GKV57375.1 hypothetical protein NCCP2222_33220 [Sporosarcina sp. NCCP-2222]